MTSVALAMIFGNYDMELNPYPAEQDISPIEISEDNFSHDLWKLLNFESLVMEMIAEIQLISTV